MLFFMNISFHHLKLIKFQNVGYVVLGFHSPAQVLTRGHVLLSTPLLVTYLCLNLVADLSQYAEPEIPFVQWITART